MPAKPESQHKPVVRPRVKWPTVANRHRNEAIMRLGEIITESRTIIERLPNLSRAIDTGNILLGDALVNETRTRIQLIIEIAASAQTTLENAPAGDEANAQDVD